MAFRGKSGDEKAPGSPELLFSTLPRSPGGSSSLWVHQGDLLRRYAQVADAKDLAVELPTGTGKTLPGLLIAEWNRLKRRSPVVFACPTRQLARQAHAAALREGIRAVLLIGSHKGWDARDALRYSSAQAIAVCTYNTVFNSSPKLEQPAVLVFDDAHAGEQYVAGQYTLRVPRESSQYVDVIGAVRAGIDGTQVQRFLEPQPDSQITHSVQLVLPLRDRRMRDSLDQVLSRLEGNERFTYSLIRGGLAACLVHVSYGAITIRPLLPPTDDNLCFSGAAQRVYLSATLGEGGELERAFGRARIERLTLPPDSAAPRAGRRLFVFPSLAEGGVDRDLVRRIVLEAGKALVLTQDHDSADHLIEDLNPRGWPIFRRDDIEDGFEPFMAAPNAICSLANRYDGIDLPGSSCRLVVLSGLPDADSLHERFLAQRARVGVALAQRIRTRVVQGFGRCTRGPSDWAVVVVDGQDLTQFILKPDFLDALTDEMRAEIQLGVANAEVEAEELLDNIRSFLDQDQAWLTDGESALDSFRSGEPARAPEGAEKVGAVVALEVEACALAWRGQWRRAAELLHQAASHLSDESVRPYRAFLLYISAVWMDHAGEIEDDPALRASARQMVRTAEQAAIPARWVAEMSPLPGDDPAELGPADAAAVTSISHVLATAFRSGQHESRVERVMSGLSQIAAGPYESALSELGLLLGADASKPTGSGRCDSVWCWENSIWLAIEAKSEHDPQGVIPQKDLRQSNDQLRLLAADRGCTTIPAAAATVLISPKTAVDPSWAPSAESHVHLAHPGELLQLARDATSVWEALAPARHGKDEHQLRPTVTRKLSELNCLPSQVLERLTQNPVH